MAGLIEKSKSNDLLLEQEQKRTADLEVQNNALKAEVTELKERPEPQPVTAPAEVPALVPVQAPLEETKEEAPKSSSNQSWQVLET